MYIDLQVEGFRQKRWTHLNQEEKLCFKFSDLRRSLITVGYANPESARQHLGAGRQRYLTEMIKAFVWRDQHSQAVMKNYFERLAPSEKVSVTFFLAQGFAHLFAQKMMGLDYLFHLMDQNSQITFRKNPLKLKTRTPHRHARVAPHREETNPPPPTNPRPARPKKSRPDFIGTSLYEKKHRMFEVKHHVVEVKGRTISSGHNVPSEAINEALKQVSQVRRVYGKSPETRTAMCFGFKTSRIHGEIIDPPEDADPPEDITSPETDISYDLHFRIALSLLAPYAFFMKPSSESSDARRLMSKDRISLFPEFTGYNLPGIGYYAVDQEVLEIIEKIQREVDKWPGTKVAHATPGVPLDETTQPPIDISMIKDENGRSEGLVKKLARHLNSKVEDYERFNEDPFISVGSDGIMLISDGVMLADG